MYLIFEFCSYHLVIDTSKQYSLVLKTLKCHLEDEIRIPEPSFGSPVFACRFSHIPGYEHMLALANEDGYIYIQNTKLQSPSAVVSEYFVVPFNQL